MAFTNEQLERYSRHIILKEVGVKGQKKLLNAKVLIIGAGGLGDFAIRYGHDRNQVDVTYVTVLVLVIFVSVIQYIGTFIEKKNIH